MFLRSTSILSIAHLTLQMLTQSRTVIFILMGLFFHLRYWQRGYIDNIAEQKSTKIIWSTNKNGCYSLMSYFMRVLVF